MAPKFRILVSDRNRRVRQYLAREMAALGYDIVDIGAEEELWPLLERQTDIDLIILDPEIIRGDAGEALRRLKETRPTLPVIVHTFEEEKQPSGALPESGPHMVIKSGPSAERLKEAVFGLLCRHYPHRIGGDRPGVTPGAQ